MITIGQMATTDDVANVLAHFSRDRTARRKEAIDAAVRAAPPSIQQPRPPSVHTVVAPQVPSSSPQPLAEMYVPPRMGATQVLGMHVSPGEGPGTGATGTSMRTMQGAALSGPPPAPTNTGSRIFAGIVIFGFVTMLGIVIGVLVARGGNPGPSIQAAAGQPNGAPRANNAGASSAAVAPTDLPTIVTPTPQANAIPDPATPGIILGASDGGGPPPATSSTQGAAPTGNGPSNPGKTVVPSKKNRVRAGKSDPGDDYGF
jgi:hypothetical protein